MSALHITINKYNNTIFDILELLDYRNNNIIKLEDILLNKSKKELYQTDIDKIMLCINKYNTFISVKHNQYIDVLENLEFNQIHLKLDKLRSNNTNNIYGISCANYLEVESLYNLLRKFENIKVIGTTLANYHVCK